MTIALLKELERAGLIRSGSGTIDKEFWKLPRPSDSKGLALKALLEERITNSFVWIKN